MIGHRAELLAKLLLTRRMNVDVIRFDEGGEMGIDYLCSIRSEKVPGFMLFGVLVWGTSDDLSTEAAVVRHVRTRRKKLDEHSRYFFPVIALLCSMRDDRAYYSWLAEPCEETGQLVHVVAPVFQEFDVKELDRVTKRVTKWYQKLATTLVVDSTELSHCPDDE